MDGPAVKSAGKLSETGRVAKNAVIAAALDSVTVGFTIFAPPYVRNTPGNKYANMKHWRNNDNSV